MRISNHIFKKLFKKLDDQTVCLFLKKRRYVIVVALVIFLIYYVIGNRDLDDKEKIQIIEESIRSLSNQRTCNLPKLPVNSPELQHFFKDEPPIDCGDEDNDWVLCVESKCEIKKHIVQAKGPITCEFTDIIRDTDFRNRNGKVTVTRDVYILKESDFVRVRCWSDNKENWYGTLLGIRQQEQQRYGRISWNGKNSQFLNVLIFGFDSMSRNAFVRKLPKSYKYLVEQLKTDVLEGYNIVGDGTPQALIPILTGFTELELPETRRRKSGANFVNVYPFIWKEYEKHGFATSYNEDLPYTGTFSYRLKGFEDQPTDHYMRPYYLALDPDLGNQKRLCFGSQPRHKLMMDYTTQFVNHYAEMNKPSFIFSFHGELSHDSINLIGLADNDLRTWLEELSSTGVLNRTIFVLMSDHGNRFAEIRNTLQGKQEERLPFFSFTFPEWFKSEYREQYENFVTNKERLTTPFDVHATLEDILMLPNYRGVYKSSKSRAISLFDKIPKTRSCADAYIEPHWCACLNWLPIEGDTTSEEVYRSANTVVDFINQATHAHRKLCTKLELGKIEWAAKLAPHENLIKFKQSSDRDGFLADLNSHTQITHEMYQVKFTTLPGNAIYEASILYDLKTDKFHVKQSDISRVNKYGKQADCIYEVNPELRKYCYCKQ